MLAGSSGVAEFKPNSAWRGGRTGMTGGSCPSMEEKKQERGAGRTGLGRKGKEGGKRKKKSGPIGRKKEKEASVPSRGEKGEEKAKNKRK